MAWPPSPEAVYIEALLDAQHAGSVLVEHFDEPFLVVLADDQPDTLLRAAFAYVSAVTALPGVASRFSLPPNWTQGMEHPSRNPFFDWMPEQPQDPPSMRSVAPYGSFRQRGAAGALLLASDRLDAKFIGSGFGLAVNLHLRTSAGRLEARFSSFAATLPYDAYLAAPMDATKMMGLSLTSFLADDGAVQAVQSALGMSDVVFRGVGVAMPGGPPLLQLHGIAIRQQRGTRVPYAVTVEGRWNQGPESYALTHASPLIADAAGCGSVFVDDPSSSTGKLVRPSHRGIGDDRSSEEIGPAKRVKLAHPPGATPVVKVMPCPDFVRADRKVPRDQPLEVDLPGDAGDPAVRSERASAVQAFVHARDLYERLKAYGWTDPATYFHLMRPEVLVQYHSGIVPGPGKDGRTVNARVIPDGWKPDQVKKGGNAGNTDPRPSIYIHVGAADLRRRARAPWQPGGYPSPAVQFGLAADRRWMWHEFGHVLLVASTGELEFRFAHSAGDALAAIVADPTSRLTGAARGMTFPFVFLPRYHNRCACTGWSWSGTQHAALAAVPPARQPLRKGYASEQILSSSLFRLYRCIGGDTCVDGDPQQALVEERLRASHYAVFLVMKAISLMPDARVHATATPAQFVDLLMHADWFAQDWSAAFPKHTYARIGGTARKVIRWAFEAQGLYGDGNAVGAPPQVDIYIQDRRPAGDEAAWGGTDYGPGGYVPVSLHWPGAGQPAAAWQADPQAGIVVNGGSVAVVVSNRGSSDAKGVVVELWLATWNADAQQLRWNTGAWNSLGTANAQDVPKRGGTKTFTFQYNPPPGRHILVAIATCLADRANTDAVLGLPCATSPTPFIDLVANDNNIALRVLP